METFTLVKYLFSKNSYVCPLWIFTFDIDQAPTNVIITNTLHQKIKLWSYGTAVYFLFCFEMVQMKKVFLFIY